MYRVCAHISNTPFTSVRPWPVIVKHNYKSSWLVSSATPIRHTHPIHLGVAIFSNQPVKQTQ